MNFEIGEIAIGQNFIYKTDRNEMSCTISTVLRLVTTVSLSTGIESTAYRYKVIWEDGITSNQESKYLRKRHEPGNWEDEEFKDTLTKLGWNPMITAGEG